MYTQNRKEPTIHQHPVSFATLSRCLQREPKMFTACHLQCEVLSNPALGHSSRVGFLLPWGSLALEEFSKGTNIQEKKKKHSYLEEKKF